MTKFRPLTLGWKTRTGIILCRVSPFNVVLAMNVNKHMHMFNWVCHLEFFGREQPAQAKGTMNSMLSILLRYQTGIISGPNPIQWDRCQRSRETWAREGVYLTVAQPPLFQTWRERHPTVECSTGVFLWSETFNAILTRASFSMLRSSSHSKEWLFSLPVISVCARRSLWPLGLLSVSAWHSDSGCGDFCSTVNNVQK